MLYRPLTPAARLAASVWSAMGSVGAAIARFRKSGTDTAYLEGASEHMLRDVGLSRIEARPDPWRLIG
jgi:uncharacterized protein YjiS (DUF1127 family)